MFVLGIDPGLSRCGYGYVERTPGGVRAVAAGVLTTDADLAVPRRLADLQAELRSLLDELGPDVVAVERVLFSANARTAMGVAQAAGVAMAEASSRGIDVVEYSPNEVKHAICGFGSADKAQVERMVQTLLRIESPLRPVDAADAVALALCHLAHEPLRRRAAIATTTPGAGA
jgi:crossover junction endodeoxyribonuclease RuvC